MSVLTALVTGAAVASPARATEAGAASSVYVVQSSQLPVWGATSQIDGVLVSGSDPIPRREVEVAITPLDSESATKTLTVTTDKRGRFRLTHRASTSFRYVATFAGDDHYDASQANATQRVMSRIKLHAPQRNVRSGRAATFTGRVLPGVKGTRVRLFLGYAHGICGVGAPPAKRLLATSRVRADGSFKLRTRFAGTGSRTVFVAVDATDVNAAGYTGYRVIKVN